MRDFSEWQLEAPVQGEASPLGCCHSPEASRKGDSGMAHLYMAVLEFQSWVTKVIPGEGNDARKVDSREEQIGSSRVLAVRRERERLRKSAPDMGLRSSLWTEVFVMLASGSLTTDSGACCVLSEGVETGSWGMLWLSHDGIPFTYSIHFKREHQGEHQGEHWGEHLA